MTASTDITGRRFGKLVAIRRDGSFKNRSMWIFQCDCGKEHRTAAVHVLHSGVHCCGCLTGGRTHGLKGSRIYSVWSSMRSRCGHNAKGTANYAGRGIRVCDEWQDLAVFSEWAEKNGYAQNLQLDRIDNDGNYEPGNCRFVTPMVNCNNKRTTPKFIFHGEPLTISQAARKYGLVGNTIKERLHRGMTPEQAVALPRQTSNQFADRATGR